tara:strand:- start:108 stop:980 length:873 start_codon:yes stop_codon:yes gene_type:complete
MKKSKKNMTTFNVMLAHSAPKTIDFKNNDTFFIQPKLDGVRCYITKDGAFSRNHKQLHNCKHILTELKPLFADNPSVILDGELYNHKFKNNFNKIISLVRKQKPTQQDKFEAASYLQFHCYDLFSDYDSYSYLKFIDRTLAITNLQSKYKLRFTKTVDTKVLYSETELNKIHNENKQNGYEGSIIRANKLYEQKRSHNLWKVKDFNDTEATIIGWVEGQGKRTGTIGKFLARDANGIEFGMPVMDKMPVLKKMYDIAEWYIGKTATFTYFQRTPSGSYRHPLFKTVRNYE